MNIQGRRWRTIWELPDADGVEVIDQRYLPHRLITAELRTPEDMAIAIRDMYVRGAPLIGAAAGYGVYLAAKRVGDDRVDSAIQSAADVLIAARPTAVNLRWAVHFVLARVAKEKSGARKRQIALETA